MSTEKLLIDANKAQAVLVNMAEHLQEAGNPEMAGVVGYAAEVIGKQPTVDAVEVVRCQDCDKISPSVTPIKDAVWCREFRAYMPCGGFCSYGERREGE